MVSDQQLAYALSEHLDLPFLLRGALTLDREVVAALPYGYLEAHACLPTIAEDGHRVLAMSDPLDFATLDFLRETTGFRWEPAVAAESDIIAALRAALGTVDRMEELVHQLGTRDDFAFDTSAKDEIEVRDVEAETAPAVQIVRTLIAEAIDARASDIHIEPAQDSLEVRYRVDGRLRESAHLPMLVHAAVVSRIKVMADMDISERRKPQDGVVRAHFRDRSIDLRISTLPTALGEKVVLRILDRTSGPSQLDDCGFGSTHVATIREALERPQGVIIVSGPTGSGKSTTLYAALLHLRDPSRNIVTIEDPVERFIGGISQVQVNDLAGLTFASGLRAFLRQDPDVIMVGEVRDQETAEIAMRASLTGHLVLTTLHTNDVIATITRLRDIGVDAYLIASSVHLLIAQRLLRTNCSACLADYTPHAVYLSRVERVLGYTPGPRLRKGVGCEACGHTGYLGRTVVYEMLPVSEPIRQLIALGAPEHELWKQARHEGMLSMFEMGAKLVSDGLTTVEELLHSVPPPTQGEAPETGPSESEASSALPGAGMAFPGAGDDRLVVLVPRGLASEVVSALQAATAQSAQGAPPMVLVQSAPPPETPLWGDGQPVDIDLEALVREALPPVETWPSEPTPAPVTPPATLPLLRIRGGERRPPGRPAPPSGGPPPPGPAV